ncbi:MAG TPA: calcium-binding EGF-like domain-containing protein [Kofleriaceae bacterium]|nr:calcium-binding EGF-like domain-containing protein [Kofleriaceae bacterium]
MRFALLALLSLASCTEVTRCKTSTLLVAIVREGVALDGDTLRIEVSLDGSTPIPTHLAVPVGQATGNVQVDFPAGYPEGKTVSVAVSSLRGATLLAAGAASLRLGAGCERMDVSVSALDPGADLSPPADLAAPDLALADLAGSDACGAMPTYCSGHGICDNTATGPVCTCNTGYTGARCNMCAADHQDNDGDGSCRPRCGTAGLTCNNAGTCSDTTGVATCTCLPEFMGANCDQCRAITAKSIFLFSAGPNPVSNFPGRAGADARVTTALPSTLPGLPTAVYRARGFISMTGDAIKDFPARYCVPTAIPINGITAAGVQTALSPTWGDFMDGMIPATIGPALGYQDFNYFWSGSTNLGAASGHDCSGWTNTTATDASISNRSNTTTNWLNSLDNAGCGSGYFLLGLAYCVANCP